MKIMLLNPPQDNLLKSEVPNFVQRETALFPPLGLLYIAAQLEQKGGHELIVLDAVAERLKEANIVRIVKEYSPSIVGISTYTHNLLNVLKFASAVKGIDKDIHISLGGPHIRTFPMETIKIPYIDSLVLGEGEETFSELVDCLAKAEKPYGIKGLFFKDDGQIVSTGARPELSDIDSLPFPNRLSINYKAYYNLLSEERAVTTILSSRGCPYSCNFCDTPRGTYRARSPKNIIEEIKIYLDIGIREIYFIDDTFNVDVDRTLELCDEIMAQRLAFKWSCRARVDRLPPKLTVKMKAAGCKRIHLGVEVATDEGLKRLNKGITIEQVKGIFDRLKREGISTVAYFMLGCPHEKTRGDVLSTIEFALSLEPDFALFNILTPYPSTQLYKDGLERGIFKRDFWKDFAENPDDRFVPQFWEEHLSAEELFRLLRGAYRRFYIRPKFILRQITKRGGIAEFFKKMRIGCLMLR